MAKYIGSGAIIPKPKPASIMNYLDKFLKFLVPQFLLKKKVIFKTELIVPGLPW